MSLTERKKFEYFASLLQDEHIDSLMEYITKNFSNFIEEDDFDGSVSVDYETMGINELQDINKYLCNFDEIKAEAESMRVKRFKVLLSFNQTLDI